MEILILNGLINGLIVGGVYALIGLSLTLLYGVLRIVNFAHGEFVIGGSFLAYVLFNSLGIAPLLALPLAAVVFFAAGWGAYYVLIPRLARSDDPENMSFLMMYGLSIALAAVMLLIFEADSRSIDYAFSPISMKVGPIYGSTARILHFGLTVRRRYRSTCIRLNRCAWIIVHYDLGAANIACRVGIIDSYGV